MRELALSIVAQRCSPVAESPRSPEELVERVRNSDWGKGLSGEVLFGVGTLSSPSAKRDQIAIDVDSAGDVKIEAQIAGLGRAIGVLARDGWLQKLQTWESPDGQTASQDGEASEDGRFRSDKLRRLAIVREPLNDVIRVTWIACYNDGVLVSVLGERGEATKNADDVRRRWTIKLTDSQGTDYRPVELLDIYHHGESVRQCIGFSPGIPRDVSALTIQDGGGTELLVPLIN